MKRTFPLMLTALWLMLTALRPALSHAQPAIGFLDEAYDFGEVVVKPGRSLEHTFEFVNKGDKELVISGLVPS